MLHPVNILLRQGQGHGQNQLRLGLGEEGPMSAEKLLRTAVLSAAFVLSTGKEALWLQDPILEATHAAMMLAQFNLNASIYTGGSSNAGSGPMGPTDVVTCDALIQSTLHSLLAPPHRVEDVIPPSVLQQSEQDPWSVAPRLALSSCDLLTRPPSSAP